MRGYILLDIRETDHCGMDRNACTASESMNTVYIHFCMAQVSIDNEGMITKS